MFEVRIPFQNKTGSDLLADNIKRPDLRVEDVNVSAPFELVDVDPKLPVSVAYRGSAEIRLRIRAPAVPYAGPLNITLGEKAGSMVRVEIQKIVGQAKGRKIDLEEAPSVLSVQKGQVLKRDIQLYKILGYGDAVSGISVSGPFVFSGSDPKPPFRIDKRSSFIVSVFVLAPDQSYAGPLEISFSS